MRLLIGVDASDGASRLVEQALRALRAPPGAEAHLVCVLPPPVVSVPPSPVATAAAVTAVLAAQEQQHRADEARARDMLQAAAQACTAAGIPRSHVHAHVLPAAGGASGVGESLVEFARVKGVDLVAVGSRGMGAVQRSLMSLVGLGSVSDYLSHNLNIPVLVLRPQPPGQAPAAAGAGEAGQPRTVVLAVDDSVHSSHALRWYLDHAASPEDEVHVACVALPVPYPILDETSAAVAALEAQEWQRSSERSYAYARELAGRAAAAAAAGGAVRRERAVPVALAPEGGASDVGAAIVKYATNSKADLVIVGSRGMGSFKRSMMGFVGLGSVSDYAVHHLACPVIVVKAEEGALPQEAHHAAGAAAAAAAAPEGKNE